MFKLTTNIFQKPDLEEILASDENLLWSGEPSYGQRFFQAVGDERLFHIGILIGIAVLWSTLPLINSKSAPGRDTAIWVYSGLTFVFVTSSFYLANLRQFVLRRLVYFVTDKRAIVCRRGSNWRLGERLYVVSCPHSERFPYRLIQSRPFASVQVGTLLSYDVVQPFGLGLTHPGHSILWGRVNAPVMFDYLDVADEVIEMIRSQAAAMT